MKKYTLLFLFLLFILSSFKQDKQAYQLFSSEGKKLKYKDLVKRAGESDIVFFGELHNNPICHWLQLELSRDLYNPEDKQLILGAEMFETDNQLLLDEYLSGTIKQKNFENEAKLWPNYDTDYSPLIEFARANEVDFVATNIPRRYAAVVHKMGFEGLDSLSKEAKALLPPLPVLYDPELKGYKSMLEMMGGMGGHANLNLPKAQAIKDATMAHNILQNYSDNKLFLHFNGTYHTNDHEGIVWYIKQERPDLNILTIASVEQEDLDGLNEEFQGKADVILCIPSRMTKTY